MCDFNAHECGLVDIAKCFTSVRCIYLDSLGTFMITQLVHLEFHVFNINITLFDIYKII